MNIGFDLDKILINYPPFVSPKLIEKLYKKKDNGVLLYRIPSYPEQLFRRISHTPIFRPAIKENMELLKNIPKKENKLFLISSRFKFLEKRTLKLIKRFGLEKIFDGMYFNFENMQPHLFKQSVIDTLNLNFYIDDDLSLIRHVAKTNPRTKFFWLKTARDDTPTLPENIIPITSLAEILDHINIKTAHS